MLFLPQQPSNVTEILSASVKLYAESFTKVIGYSLMLFAINRVTAVFVTDIMPVIDAPLDNDEQTAAILQMSQMLPSVMGIYFIAILFSCVLYGAMIYRIDNMVNQRNDDFIEPLLLAVKKFPAIVAAGILYTIAITIGSLLVIPAIILFISLSFCGYFILLEDRGGYESLIASHRLVWGDWWRTNMVFFVPTLSYFISLLIIAFVSGEFNTPPEHSDSFAIVVDIFVATIMPYFYVIGYLQYHDLKLRKKM